MTGRIAARRRPPAWRLAVAMLLLAPGLGAAQATLPPATGTPGVAGERRSVEGRVVLGGPGTPVPIGGQVVVLHRISADSAGPIDSVRTTAAGRYAFRYRLEGPGAMYIASTRYAGVAYFTAPIRSAAAAGPEAEIAVYDTTSRAFPLTLRSRHFVVSPADGSGLRRVVDVFEVSNDSLLTVVTGGATTASWRVRLPDGARDPRASGGDLPPDAIRVDGGTARVEVPFAPGARQLVLTYGFAPSDPLAVPVDSPTGLLEVLVEGAGAAVSGASLVAEAAVTMEGRTFQRFVAGPVPAGASFTIAPAGGGLGGRAGRVALLGLAALALAGGIVVGRRARRETPLAGRVAAPAGAATSLARAVAALDEVYSAPSRQDEASQGHYRKRRDALMARLEALVEAEDHRD